MAPLRAIRSGCLVEQSAATCDSERDMNFYEVVRYRYLSLSYPTRNNWA